MMQEDPGAGATAQGVRQAGEPPPLPEPGPGREDRHRAAPGALPVILGKFPGGRPGTAAGRRHRAPPMIDRQAMPRAWDRFGYRRKGQAVPGTAAAAGVHLTGCGSRSPDQAGEPRRSRRRICLKVTRFSLIVPRAHTPGVLP